MLLAAMIVAQKVWDDKSLNVDFGNLLGVHAEGHQQPREGRPDRVQRLDHRPLYASYYLLRTSREGGRGARPLPLSADAEQPLLREDAIKQPGAPQNAQKESATRWQSHGALMPSRVG